MITKRSGPAFGCVGDERYQPARRTPRSVQRFAHFSDLEPAMLGGVLGSAEPLAINVRAAREVADCKPIYQALTHTENNISSAAKLLGISRPTLYDLIKQFQLGA